MSQRYSHPTEYARFVQTETPREHLTVPDEVTSAVACLGSPNAGGMTAVELAGDGGQLAPTAIGWPGQGAQGEDTVSNPLIPQKQCVNVPRKTVSRKPSPGQLRCV